MDDFAALLRIALGDGDDLDPLFLAQLERSAIVDGLAQGSLQSRRQSVADLVAHKTAVLGMTRKGKSNTMKVIAAAVHEYSQAKEIPIGQLIFDPAGEYANVNVQDGTALAEIGREHVTRFRLGATDAELDADPGLHPLALNFFDEELIAVTWSIVGQFVQSQRDADYVKSFAAADVQGPANPQAREEWKQVAYARRARAMAFACLLKAGLNAPAGWSMWVPLKESLRSALIDTGGARGQDLSFLSAVQLSRRGDQARLTAPQLLGVCEGLAANFHGQQRHAEVVLMGRIRIPEFFRTPVLGDGNAAVAQVRHSERAAGEPLHLAGPVLDYGAERVPPLRI